VLPKNIRDEVVREIGSKLRAGGYAIIGARGWRGDVNRAKNVTPGDEPKSLLIHKASGDTFQKGFDGDELRDYIQNLLPDVLVKRLPGFGASSVLITKPADTPQNMRVGDSEQAEIRRQMDAVKEVRNADGKLLAPNGKVSKLNEHQWKQTRTASFIAWFGDWLNDPENASQVVDENGEPLVVYHGATGDFDVFDFSRTPDVSLSSGKGVYITESTEAASRYAMGISWGNQGQSETPNVVPVFLNIRKPFNRTQQYRLSELSKALPEDSALLTEARETAEPSPEWLQETQDDIDALFSRLADLESLDADGLVANYPEDFRHDREDYDSDEEYEEAVEEDRQWEIDAATKQIARYEKQIDDAWASVEKDLARATASGDEIWDEILKDLDSYYELQAEASLFGGDVESIETDTEVARILHDAYGFDGVRRVDRFPLKTPHTVYIANVKPSQVKSAIGNTGAFSPSDDSILRMTIGEKGVARLDDALQRTDNLAVAREMEAAGKDAKTIWLATGWEKGGDGKWKTEIDDGEWARDFGLVSKAQWKEIVEAKKELFGTDAYGDKLREIDTKYARLIPTAQNKKYLDPALGHLLLP